MIQYDAPALNPFAILNYALEKCGKAGRPIVQSAIGRLWWDDSFGPTEVRPSTVKKWWSDGGGSTEEVNHATGPGKPARFGSDRATLAERRLGEHRKGETR